MLWMAYNDPQTLTEYNELVDGLGMRDELRSPIEAAAPAVNASMADIPVTNAPADGQKSAPAVNDTFIPESNVHGTPSAAMDDSSLHTPRGANVEPRPYNRGPAVLRADRRPLVSPSSSPRTSPTEQLPPNSTPTDTNGEGSARSLRLVLVESSPTQLTHQRKKSRTEDTFGPLDTFNAEVDANEGEEENDESPAPTETASAPRVRGRPKGSKNKKKKTYFSRS
jgi:hypothetical protein